MSNPSKIIIENVSRETLVRVDEWLVDFKPALDKYAELLLWWNRKVNLVSRDMTVDELRIHIKHCLILAAYTEGIVEDRWVDTGTGGGLPGIPFSIVFPEKSVVLNEVVVKKGLVLKDMIRKLGLNNVRIDIKDIGAIGLDSSFSVMTKHAFKLNDLLTRLADKPWKHLVFLKGADYIEELSMVDTNHYHIKVISMESIEPKSFFNGKYILHLCQTE